MTIFFNKGDEEYFDWMDSNPAGFILNTGKSPNTPYFILHKSNCVHITRYDEAGSYTMNQEVKVAAHDVSLIEDYCITDKTNFPGYFKVCKHCKPIEQDARITYPDDVVNKSTSYFEGEKKMVYVNAYERNDKARAACIEHYGLNCQCCDLNFKEKYGEIGEAFIHVHHIKPIAEVGEVYAVGPINDLIPLCLNCHAMVHKIKNANALLILKKILESSN